MKKLPILLCFATISTILSAEQPSVVVEGGADVLIFNIDEVGLQVNDDVVDGCLPRPSSVGAATEVALRRNNISASVETESSLRPTVYVSALGYSTSEYTCVIAFLMSLEIWSPVSVPYSANLSEDMKTTIVPIKWQMYSTVLTGPKSDMQERIEREAEKGANNIFIEIDRAKDTVESQWPQLWEASQDES